MTTKIKISILFIVGLTSCYLGRDITKAYFGGWIEKEPAFVNSIPHMDKKDGYFDLLMECKWFGIGLQDFYLTNTKPFQWIKKPKNIQVVHNTIKKIGYKNFISDSLFREPMKFQNEFGGMQRHDWEEMSIEQIIDNLINTYHEANRLDTNYYVKFWKRRAKEGNISEVINILEEIKEIYSGSETMYNPQFINDTIENLLRFDLKLQDFNDKPTTEFLWSYFDYLKSIKLCHSAYNLVIEKYPGQIHMDTIIKLLKLDTIPENIYWDTRNNGTWIYTYSDNGP